MTHSPAISPLVSNPLATPVLSPLTAYLLTAHPLAIRLPATRRSLHALQSIPAIILLVSNPLATPVLSPLTAYLLTAHPLAVHVHTLVHLGTVLLGLLSVMQHR
jgi:hypothetical protein